MKYAAFTSLLGFGVAGRSSSNFLASAVQILVPIRRSCWGLLRWYHGKCFGGLGPAVHITSLPALTPEPCLAYLSCGLTACLVLGPPTNHLSNPCSFQTLPPPVGHRQDSTVSSALVWPSLPVFCSDRRSRRSSCSWHLAWRSWCWTCAEWSRRSPFSNRYHKGLSALFAILVARFLTRDADKQKAIGVVRIAAWVGMIYLSEAQLLIILGCVWGVCMWNHVLVMFEALTLALLP